MWSNSRNWHRKKLPLRVTFIFCFKSKYGECSDSDSGNEKNVYESCEVWNETDLCNKTDKEDVVKSCGICIRNQKKQTSESMIQRHIAVYPI